MFTNEQIGAYLEKIGFKGEITNSFDCLKKIVEGHIFSFPYECLNVHNSKYDIKPEKRSDLSQDALFQKLVINNRGGRCVELNYFLQNMLKDLGFNVISILPDTIYHSTHLPVGQRPKHSAAIVKTGGKSYLVDAGFGGFGLLSPVPLEQNIYHQYSEKYNLIEKKEEKDYPFELQVWLNNQWLPLYAFNESSASFDDYKRVDMENRNPLNPDSWFSKYFLCTKPFKIEEDKSGRYRICNGTFLEFREAKLFKEQKIDDYEMLKSHMKTLFNIDLGKGYYRFRPEDMELYFSKKISHPILHGYNTRYAAKIKKIFENIDQSKKNEEAETKKVIRKH